MPINARLDVNNLALIPLQPSHHLSHLRLQQMATRQPVTPATLAHSCRLGIRTIAPIADCSGITTQTVSFLKQTHTVDHQDGRIFHPGNHRSIHP